MVGCGGSIEKVSFEGDFLLLYILYERLHDEEKNKDQNPCALESPHWS
jgi:hypothetical protein